MSDALIEAGQSDALIEAVRSEFLELYPGKRDQEPPTLRFAATLIVDRLRAGGISDAVIRKALCSAERSGSCPPQI